MFYHSYKLLAYCKVSSPGSLQQQSISWCGSMQACKRWIIAHCMNTQNLGCGFCAVAGNRIWSQKRHGSWKTVHCYDMHHCVAGDFILAGLFLTGMTLVTLSGFNAGTEAYRREFLRVLRNPFWKSCVHPCWYDTTSYNNYHCTVFQQQ